MERKSTKSTLKFEKWDFHLIKTEVGLNFIVNCKLGNVISTILPFSLANKSLQAH